jgi:translation initiation factor IF-3
MKIEKIIITDYNIHHYSKHFVKIVEGPITGTYSITKALEIAKENNLDLVLIKPGFFDQGKSIPGIVKILDYNKFIYIQKKQEKEILKKQKANIQKIKEVKFHIGIGENDFEYKINRIQEFVNEGDKVLCQIVLRGRENSSISLINSFVQKLKERIETIGSFSKNFERQGNKISGYIVKGVRNEKN